MAKINKRTLDALQPKDKDYWVWDDSLKGFGVRVKPSGRISFMIQYRVLGGSRTPKKLTLGAYGKLTPTEARALARDRLAAVAHGGDPAAEIKAATAAPIIATLAERYLREHAKPKKKPASYTRDKRLVERFILPALGRKKIEALTRSDVSALHHKIGQETPIQANRTLAVLSKMMTMAIRWGLRSDENNPCKFVERFKENKRENYLTPDQIALLGDALRKAEVNNTGFPTAINAIRLLLLTGARVGEILGLRWDWVNLEGGYVQLPDSKTGSKVLPLGTPAVKLLAGLDRVAGNPHVFPGRYLGQPIKDINTTWRKVRKAAGLEGTRLHDLRHSWASQATAVGLSLPIIGKVLGHSEPATTARYSHLANDPVRQAADKVATKIAEAMDQPAERKVINLSAKQ
jgi:integrase